MLLEVSWGLEGNKKNRQKMQSSEPGSEVKTDFGYVMPQEVKSDFGCVMPQKLHERL